MENLTELGLEPFRSNLSDQLPIITNAKNEALRPPTLLAKLLFKLQTFTLLVPSTFTLKFYLSNLPRSHYSYIFGTLTDILYLMVILSNLWAWCIKTYNCQPSKLQA